MKHALFDLTKIEKDYDVKDEKVFLDVKIKGVKDAYRVCCSFAMLDKSLGALSKICLEYEPVKAGESRYKAILEETRLLLDQEKYLAPIETEDGFYFGENNWSFSHTFNTYKVNFIKKISSERLELLAKRVFTDNINSKEESKEEVFYYYEQTLFTTCNHRWWLKYFESDIEDGKPLHEAVLHITERNIAIDENNYLYTYHKVKDPANIRIIPDGFVKENEKKGYTFKEWLAKVENSTPPTVPCKLDLSGSYYKNIFTFYSSQVIGTDVIEYTPKSWVYYQQQDRYGQVVRQDDFHVYVRWEDEYNYDYASIHYSELISCSAPTKLLDKPKIVKFQLTKNRKWCGYGWLIEKGVHSMKIELLDGHHHLKNYVYNQMDNSFRASKEKIEKNLIQLHDCIPNFLLCHKDEVESVTGIELKGVEKLLILNEDYAAKNLLSNLFFLADPNTFNHSYYLVQALVLHQSCKELSLFEKITNFILYKKENQTFKAWLEEEIANA